MTSFFFFYINMLFIITKRFIYEVKDKSLQNNIIIAPIVILKFSLGTSSKFMCYRKFARATIASNNAI